MMRKATWLINFCLTAGLFVLSACQSSSSSSEVDSSIRRIAVTSCTHVGFLHELGAMDRVVAVCDRDLIYTPLADSVVDLGSSMSPNIERLLQAKVDAVLFCSYPQDQVAAQIERVGIRIIPIREWQETTPLARARWIVTIGEVLGLKDKADSIYQQVEKRYQSLMVSEKDATIMTGNNYRGTWYVPAGQTFMGQLFRDAGYGYVYEDDSRTESIPLTIEETIRQFGQADVWVGSNAHSLAELAQQDEKHTWFNAYRTGQVYNWMAQCNEKGGNNFWERGVVHPEEMLEDLIRIRHHQTDSLHYAQLLH